MRRLWIRNEWRLEVLKPQVDDSGYDLVLEANGPSVALDEGVVSRIDRSRDDHQPAARCEAERMCGLRVVR
ncbi:MAG TPA: hypothetical protein VGF24_27145 [Vicinamibacterales bacterium]